MDRVTPTPTPTPRETAVGLSISARQAESINRGAAAIECALRDAEARTWREAIQVAQSWADYYAGLTPKMPREADAALQVRDELRDWLDALAARGENTEQGLGAATVADSGGDGALASPEAAGSIPAPGVSKRAETAGPSAGTQGHGSLNVQPRPQAGEASATQRTVCQSEGNAGAATRQPVVSASSPTPALVEQAREYWETWFDNCDDTRGIHVVLASFAAQHAATLQAENERLRAELAEARRETEESDERYEAWRGAAEAATRALADEWNGALDAVLRKLHLEASVGPYAENIRSLRRVPAPARKAGAETAQVGTFAGVPIVADPSVPDGELRSPPPDWQMKHWKAAPRPGAGASEAEESAWLIERQQGPHSSWWSPIEWTTPARAMRFARREDAEKLIHAFDLEEHHPGRIFASEHLWTPGLKEKS